jgi:hypothetical protein
MERGRALDSENSPPREFSCTREQQLAIRGKKARRLDSGKFSWTPKRKMASLLGVEYDAVIDSMLNFIEKESDLSAGFRLTPFRRRRANCGKIMSRFILGSRL